MSAIRNQKYFQGMSEQIKKLGRYSGQFVEFIRWAGRVDASNADGWAGFDAAILDFTASTWATANLRMIVMAEPAGDINRTDAMFTQSHAAGHKIDGSSRFIVMVESPAAWTDDHAMFLRFVQQHLVGQLAAPVQFLFTANGVAPAVKGVNGVGATAANTACDWLAPYGLTYVGGV